MIWLINGETLAKNFTIIVKPSYLTFNWKNPPTSFFYADKEIYIDVSNQLKDLDDLYDDLMERINIVYNELKQLIKCNPKDYDFKKSYSCRTSYGKDGKIELIYTGKDENESNIIQKYNLWNELSNEHSIIETLLKKFESNKTIFQIKKLYKNIPCSGWGYLISKEEFLNKVK